MKPIFTIHAGEYLFGEKIERQFKYIDLWIPAKDKGVDFLLTDHAGNPITSVQVKMSKDYRSPQAANEFEEATVAGGWYTFNRRKMEDSKADIWSIVIVSPQRTKSPIFINIPPRTLLEKITATHGFADSYQLYINVFVGNRCLEVRNITENEKTLISSGRDIGPNRNLSSFLENWSFLQPLQT